MTKPFLQTSFPSVRAWKVGSWKGIFGGRTAKTSHLWLFSFGVRIPNGTERLCKFFGFFCRIVKITSVVSSKDGENYRRVEQKSHPRPACTMKHQKTVWGLHNAKTCNYPAIMVKELTSERNSNNIVPPLHICAFIS